MAHFPSIAVRIIAKYHCASAGLWGPGTSTGPCLAASNHEILMILSCGETCPPVDLGIRDVGSPELLAEPCLIPLVGSLAISLNSEVWILSTSCLKHPRAINNLV